MRKSAKKKAAKKQGKVVKKKFSRGRARAVKRKPAKKRGQSAKRKVSQRRRAVVKKQPAARSRARQPDSDEIARAVYDGMQDLRIRHAT